MPKDVYSKDLNAVLTVPDDWTDEQIWAFEDSQKGNPVAGFVRGVVPGAIQGVSGMVEGVGGLTGSDTVKGLASLMRDNPVSKYLMERTPADYSNPGRTVGEVTGNIGSMLLPGGAARAAGLGSTAVKAATAAGSVAQSAGEATGEVRRNREAGMEITPGQELAAAYAGAPLGLVEAIPLGRLLGHTERISDLAKMGARDIVKRSVGTGLLESGTEATQQAGQNLVERIYNPQQDLLEGLGESAAAGGAAGFTLDMILQAAGKRAAGKLMRNMGRTQGESPAIPDDGVAGIGIRRTAEGNPDITAIMPPAPNWHKSRVPFLDAASKAIYDKPLSELDAATAINLERDVERARGQYQLNDKDFLDILVNMAPVGPKQNPRQLSNPNIDSVIAQSMGEGPTGVGPTAPVIPPALDENYQAPAPPLAIDLESLEVQRGEPKEGRQRPVETEGITPDKQMPKRPVQLMMTDEGTFEEPTRVRERGPGTYRQDIEDIRRRDEAATMEQFKELQREEFESAKRRPQDEISRMAKRDASVSVPETGVIDERTQDANQRISRQLFRRDFNQLTPEQVAEVDQYRNEGLGSAVNAQEASEIAEFAELPFSREQYRQAVALGRDAYAKKLPLSRTAVQGRLKTTPDIATQIMSHITKRGEGIVENGKLYVDPTAEGPMYSIITDQQSPQVYTVEAITKELDANTNPQIALDLFNELKRIGVDDLVSTKLVDGIVTKKGDSVQGAYRDRIITLSLEAADRAKLIQTLNHEAVHAMKGIGMFTDAEWSVLQSALRPELMMSDDERAKYDKYFGGDKARMNEEAIARGIERYVIGKLDLPKPATGIIAKAVNALDAIGLVARRQTAGEVIEAQQRGDIGRRPFAETVTSEASTPQPEAARPKQPASVDTELGDEFDGMDNEATNYSLTPQERQVFDKVFSPPDKRGFAQKTKEAIEDYRAASRQNLLDTFATRWRQSSIDRRAGIEKLDQTLPGGPRDAESSAIAATRFADVSGNLATAALTHGRLEYVGTPGRGYFRASDNGDGIFRKGGTLAKLNQAGKMEKMFLAMAAERADELMGEGREKLFTPAEIAIGKQAMQDPEIKAGARELKAHFDSMIDVMQASGMLTGDAANKLKAKAYFPFYRVEVDDSGSITATSPRGFTESIVKAPAGGGMALGNLPKLQKLKGGEAKIADPVENIARNTFALTSMAMRNVAAQRVMRDGKAMGYVKQVHAPTKTDNVVKVWINGRPRTFEVLDKVLYDSVMASGIEIGPLMRLLAVKPAQILRESVTSTPAFMVRNALRDSVQTWAQGYTAVPFTRILPGLRSAVMNAPSYDALQRLGVVGTGIRGEGAEGTAVNLRNNIGKETMLERANEARKKSLAASEGINRVAVFDEVRSKRGGSEIQAAYEALELLNFNRRGASPIAQLLGATIPFLNARAQGLDVLYRSAAGRGMGGKKMQRAVINRGIALAGLSTLYALLSMGQDYYENAAPEERDMFWFVPTGAGEPLKVPIPFELGIFSKVLPERFTNLYFGGDNATDLRKSIQRAVSGVMEIDLPQAVKPVNEVLNNYDTFRQRAIESAAMQRLEAPFRYDEYTSEIAKAIGQVTGASPLQVDHIMKGYTGGLGVMALGFLDYLIEGGTGPEARVSEPHTLPVVGSLFQRRDGGRALVDFYEMRDIAEQAAATQRAMAAQGITEAPDKIAERARKAAVEAATRPTDLALAKLRKYRKMVQSSTELDPAQKRDALNEIRRREIELVKPTKGLRELLQ